MLNFAPRLNPLRIAAVLSLSLLASYAPSVANFFSRTAPFNSVMKWIIGIAPQRRVPTFAPETFKSWFANQEVRNRDHPAVILWADTFNNYFHPEPARCAVKVLEDAGFHVVVPQANFCCGRPFYDFGLLKPARKYLEHILKMLAAEIEAGIPIVMLEPSCCSVFRDELVNLLPHHQNAKRLRQQTFTLAEFLTRRAPDYRAPILRRRAILHGHCHQKALMTMRADETLLRRMQVQCEHLDSGCCGMAGAFGYVKGEHYDVSVRCGERVLLPRVRNLRDDEILITDGFSCREQVEQQTGKSSLHLAEVLHLALATGEREPLPEAPAEPREDIHAEDRDYLKLHRDENSRGKWTVAIGGVAVAAAVCSVASNIWRRK